MYAEARESLETLPPAVAQEAEALHVWVALTQEEQDWRAMAETSCRLTELCPEDAGAWISLAYAMRRLRSLEAAREILVEAEKLHPKEATIAFNLGCYAAQMGELKRALLYVRRAIELDKSFEALAKTDEDLRPLHEAHML